MQTKEDVDMRMFSLLRTVDNLRSHASITTLINTSRLYDAGDVLASRLVSLPSTPTLLAILLKYSYPHCISQYFKMIPSIFVQAACH